MLEGKGLGEKIEGTKQVQTPQTNQCHRESSLF